VDAVVDLIARPEIRAPVIVVGSLIAAWLTGILLGALLVAVARRATADPDHRIVAALRRPIFLSVLFIGLFWAAETLELPARAMFIVSAVLMTLAILVWASAAFRTCTVVLESLSRQERASSIVQARTLPVFEILIRLLVVGAAIYFTFLAWSIDVTAWLASAGIIGIAVGFAAKDTLANFFAGIFIIADAPYKVGDWIVLDGGLRGKVTRIGVRSTRILTGDDIEITIPNSVIGGSKIINEAGGPSTRQRIRIRVSCAYGSDIDKVREILHGCARDTPDVCAEPAPEVRFCEFGESGLLFELRVWLDDPARRDGLIDQLNCRIYREFTRSGIEIPYPKRDLYIRQQAPAGGDRGAEDE
jgi:MscS family membrane protein